MDQNNIEKRLKEQIQDYESPVNTNEIWDNIEDQIPGKDKNKKRLIIWWFFGGFFLSAFLLWLYTSQNTVEPNGTLTTKTASTSQKSLTSKEESENCPEDHLAESGKLLAESRMLLAESKKLLAESRKLKVESRKPLRESSTGTRKRSRGTSSSQNNTASSFSDSQFQTSPMYSDPSEPGTISDSSDDPLKQAINPTAKEQLTPDESTIKSGKDSKKLADKQDKKSVDKTSDKNKSTKDNVKKDKVTKIPVEKNKKSTPKKKRKKRSKWTHVVEFYLGGDIPLKQLKGNLNSEPLKIIRKETENVLYGYNGGMNYKVFHKNGLLLKSGFQYQQIDEKMEVEITKQEERSISILESVVVNASNDTISRVYKPVKMMVTVISQKQIYNRYRMVNLPMMIGRRIENRNWQYEIAGGFDFNLLYFQKGSILNNNKAPQKIKYALNKKTVGVGLLGSFNIQRPINKNISLFAEPTIKMMLGSMTPKDYPLVQRYTLLGIRAGVQVNVY